MMCSWHFIIRERNLIVHSCHRIQFQYNHTQECRWGGKGLGGLMPPKIFWHYNTMLLFKMYYTLLLLLIISHSTVHVQLSQNGGVVMQK